jgi:hypothetical protein
MLLETKTFALKKIGHSAENLKKLFAEYSPTPDKKGNFLTFENYVDADGEPGVMVTSNYFHYFGHFEDTLQFKLLLVLQEGNKAFTMKELIHASKNITRQQLIRWLKWNDRNGVYTDEESKREFGKVMSKYEAMRIIKRQILNC